MTTGDWGFDPEQQEPMLVRRPREQAADALHPVLLRGGRGQVRDDGPVPTNPHPPGRDEGRAEGVPLVGPAPLRRWHGAQVYQGLREERQ